jgi:hypothetical protein
LTIVSAAWRFASVALQQQSVLRHQSSLSDLFTLSIEQCSDPSRPLRRSIIRQRADRSQHLCILRLLISPSRATPFAKTRVKLRASDAERVGDYLHSEPSPGNDGKRQISFFHGQP